MEGIASAAFAWFTVCDGSGARAPHNIDPKHINPDLTTAKPYVMGANAICSGAWTRGSEDIAPPEYQWGYNRMMTSGGLFGAGN